MKTLSLVLALALAGCTASTEPVVPVAYPWPLVDSVVASGSKTLIFAPKIWAVDTIQSTVRDYTFDADGFLACRRLFDSGAFTTFEIAKLPIPDGVRVTRFALEVDHSAPKGADARFGFDRFEPTATSWRLAIAQQGAGVQTLSFDLPNEPSTNRTYRLTYQFDGSTITSAGATPAGSLRIGRLFVTFSTP